MTSRARLGLVALLLADGFIAGCYAAPPLRISAGGGGAAGAVVTIDANTRYDNSLAGVGELRLGTAPLSYRPERRLDLAVGWALDSAVGADAGDKLRHGPYLEAGWFLRRGGASSRQGWRLGSTVGLEASVPTKDDQVATDVGPVRDLGLGGSVGVVLESIEAVRGHFPLGRAFGELGVGISARIGVRNENDGTYGYGIVSVEFRLPGAYGSVF